MFPFFKIISFFLYNLEEASKPFIKETAGFILEHTLFNIYRNNSISTIIRLAQSSA